MSTALVTMGLVRKLTFDGNLDAGWRTLHDNTPPQSLMRDPVPRPAAGDATAEQAERRHLPRSTREGRRMKS
eukprot:690607-Prymnesium_polylepis.2